MGYPKKSYGWKDPFGANKKKRTPGKDIDAAFGKKHTKRSRALANTNRGISDALISTRSRIK